MKRTLLTLLVVAGLVLLSRYTYLLPFHIAAVFATVFMVVVADVHAGLWVIGKIKLLPKWRMEKLHQIVSLGLLAIVVTGVSMFWPVQGFLLYESSFQVKVLFVLALIVNSLVIARHMGVASAREFAELSLRERWPLLFSGAVSTLSWVGAFIAAQFLPL